MRLNVVTGASNLIADNTIIDDRASSLLFNAVQVGTGSLNIRVLRNLWIGWTSAPMDSFTGVVNVEGNLPYHRNVPLNITVTTPPLTTVAYTNAQPWPVYAYFSGGTITAITKTHAGGSPVAIGTPTCIYLRPGDSFTPTYTGSPTLTIDAA